MKEALAEVADEAREAGEEVGKMEEIEEIPDEEEEDVEVSRYALEEKEEEKAYAEMMWVQVDSSHSS
ncbi:hypothetical protein LINPERPRIM_LOCUS37642 [Linum perenne]